MVRCWHLESARQVEILEAHTNGVMAIELCRGLLITSSFDKYVITWDIEELEERMSEKIEMYFSDVESRKYLVYLNELDRIKKSRVSSAGGSGQGGSRGKNQNRKR